MVKEYNSKEEMPFVQKNFCFLSTFPPKECGIATFTRDLSMAMDKKFNPKLKSQVIAINDDTDIYNYGKNVKLKMNKEDIEDYIKIAEVMNNSDNIKLVHIQHEFGLFGGEYGSYLIAFLEKLTKPVLVTFHSVLPEPDERRRKVVRAIADNSSGIVVLANKAVEILKQDYGIEENKIHVIYHGIPDVQFKQNRNYKNKLGLDKRIVLSTFGLLSAGKGIEYAIRSMPKLVKKYPNILYLVIGETHPVVRKNEGEKYRNSLIREVKRLGLEDNVKFCNSYLDLKGLIEYLLASDIYLCTNLEKNQIVSGTLSYAMGCGKAVVSTPFLYAEEMLADNRGMLVTFKNPNSFTEAIDKLISDKELKKNIEKNAYFFSRQMIWPNIATRHLSVFNQIVKLREEVTEKYPKINLKHVKRLTDDLGMIQFSKLSQPDKESGYTVDDNSRALIAAVMHHRLMKSNQSLALARTYLKFLEHSQDDDGTFNNVITKDKRVNDSEDAFGRAIWSLGFAIENSIQEIRENAELIFNKSFPLIKNLIHIRAKAFTIIGLCHYYKKYPKQEILDQIKSIADSLRQAYEENESGDWRWFEDNLTYSNSKIPESLFYAYDITKDNTYLEIAEKSLAFLSDLVFIGDKLVPIGQNGWHNRNGVRAFFDQQPVDAASIVQTYLAAFNFLNKKEYYNKAVLAFNWFLGKNHLNQMIYNESTGGCFDGLSEDRVNLNQGAESTISYLIARLCLEEAKKQKSTQESIPIDQFP